MPRWCASWKPPVRAKALCSQACAAIQPTTAHSRESGNPGAKNWAKELGPRFRGDERKTIRLSTKASPPARRQQHAGARDQDAARDAVRDQLRTAGDCGLEA